MYTYFTNAKVSFRLAPGSGEGCKATVDFDSDLPGDFQLKALSWVSHGLSACHHLDAGFSLLMSYNIIRQDQIYQKCQKVANPYSPCPLPSSWLPSQSGLRAQVTPRQEWIWSKSTWGSPNPCLMSKAVLSSSSISRTIVQNQRPKDKWGASPDPMARVAQCAVVWSSAKLQRKTGIQLMESLLCRGLECASSFS